MEEGNRLVTVICSNYNSSLWIYEYLNSINNQFLLRFDIIFIDANSSDTSLQSIKEYKFRNGITKKVLELNERVNVYEAWNKAISVAETPYIININTDDRLYPAGLITYLNYAKFFPSADILYGSCIVCDDIQHNNIVSLFMWPSYNHEILLNMCFVGPFPLLKRSTIIEDGMFDSKYTISGDYEMWLRMSKKNRVFLRVVEPVGSYYRNPKGISTNNETFEEHLKQDTKIREIYR